MSYIGQAALKNSELKRFDVTSSTSATHVLSWTAPNEQSLWITINGVKQQDDAYSIAGTPTTITRTAITRVTTRVTSRVAKMARTENRTRRSAKRNQARLDRLAGRLANSAMFSIHS